MSVVNTILDLIFIIFMIKFMQELGFVRAVFIFAVIVALVNFAMTMSISVLFSSFIWGLIYGAIGYLLAMFFVFIIGLLGSIGIGLFIIAMLIAFASLIASLF